MTVTHGGDLADARRLAGGEADDWLDLSTGISPYPYPFSAPAAEPWTRLPGREALGALIEAAATYYRAPGHETVVAGPGSQSLIQRLPALFEPARVSVIGPTYGGHAPAWEAAGHDVRDLRALPKAPNDGIAVLVNPNNPDGRIVTPDALAREAETRTAAGGWLVIDEAFGDVALQATAAPLCKDANVVVLKSFGKFFGLAGLRLGFVIAPPALADRLTCTLGCWAVSGPAIAIGRQALCDTAWQQETRARLDQAAAQLDGLFAAADLTVGGGTALFRLVESEHAPALFDHLLKARIYVRRFTYDARWLRIGLPGSEAGFSRLEAALESFPP